MMQIGQVAMSKTQAKRMRRELKRDPTAKAATRDLFAEAERIFRAQVNSGAQFAADEQLRYHLRELNNRAWHFGLNSLPSSANLTEAFFRYDPELNFFRLLPENDYLIATADFFDFVTAPGAPPVDLQTAYDFREGVIYNFSVIDDPREFMVETSGGNSYALISTSMVRRGDELCVIITAGSAGDDLRLVRDATARAASEDWISLSEVRADESHETTPIMLKQYPELLRVEAMARFNLQRRTIDARYLLLDCGSFFQVITDDDVVYDFADRKHRHVHTGPSRETNAERLEERSALFELMKTVVLLPAYLRAKVTIIREETAPTRLAAAAAGSTRGKREIDQLAANDRILVRRISSLRVIRPHGVATATGRSYTPPRFQVPVEGFWRTFANADRIGHDEAGNPITGRTWVRPHTRYQDHPTSDAPKIVYLKSSLAAARAQLSAWRDRYISGPQGVQSQPTRMSVETARAFANPESDSGGAVPEADSLVDEQPGAYVYVMRCPAHGGDIYKVGFSKKDPELRARELSSGTATPIQFVVIQAWAVTEGRLAEAAAHSTLAAFRLANQREFFRAKFSDLRTRLEAAITPWLIS